MQLEVQYDPPEKRAPEIARLYDNWINDLQANLAGDILELQRRVTEGKLTEYDKKYLRWFVDHFGLALLLRMQGVLDELYDKNDDKNAKKPKIIHDATKLSPTAQLELISQHKGEIVIDMLKEIKKLEDEKKIKEIENKIVEIKEIYSFGQEHVNDLEKVLERLRDVNLEDIFSKPSPEQRELLRRTAGWAVWGTHFEPLKKLVGITAPKFDTMGYLSDGLKVTTRRSYYEDKSIGESKSDDPEERILMATLKDRGRIIQNPDNFNFKDIGDTGVARFVKRIYRAEQEIYAATVQPKEHAQNISEASARETMLNLVLALSAMLPNSGVNAGNKSQYVRRAQTYLHAITRQPLLVGYGNGERRFGWFLGPAFRVENGKADFVHRVTRHDVSAGIVIPAWQNQAKLLGSQLWIDDYGQPTNKVALWDDKPILLNVRIPADASKHITSALLAHSLAEVPSLYTARPYPVIAYPDPSGKKVIRVQSVLPTEKDTPPQWVLVLGRDLWRNPQVFLGSIKADSVEVLSNMEGVLAKFERIPYPDTLTGPTPQRLVSVDLTVITSFGRDRCEGGVEILPPINLPAAEPEPATLFRPYVDDVEKALGFRLDRPAAYGGIKLFLKPAEDALSQFKVQDAPAKWTDDNKTVYFELIPGDTKQVSRLWLADLRIYSRPDTDSDTKSLTKKGGQEFAWFVNKSERSPTLAVSSIEYDVEGKAKSGFDLTFDQNRLKALYCAYPGLSETIASSKAMARLSLGDVPVVDVPLSAPDSPKPQKLLAAKATLESLRQKLLSNDIKGKDLDVALVYIHSPDGKSVAIPVVTSDGKPAKLKFTQEVKQPK